ncbi:MAG: glycosyltransferase [Acidobacteriota bacterium]|nr:glycosyltransferase [Acidobacteriota bacterium]
MRILLVTSRYPVPAWRGNQVRAIEWLSALSTSDVLLMCPPEGGGGSEPIQAKVAPFSSSPIDRAIGLLRAAASGRPFQEGLYDGGGARRAIAGAVRDFSPDVAIIQMVRCGWAAETVFGVGTGVPVVFDAIDAMGLHFDRAARSAPFWSATFLRSEGGRCRRRERWLSRSAAYTVAVSDRDLDELSVPEGRGRVIPVAGREAGPGGRATNEQIVLLSGNLGYRPTVEGAQWFAQEVWPRVRAQVPDARWILAGARPSSTIRRLSRSDGVEVHADVPDLGAYMGRTRVAVAPMSSGSGVPIKVLEAMAAGVPAVVHPWAADGLAADAVPSVVVAENADSWVEHLVRLLGDEAAAQDLGGRGRSAWRRSYHPEVVAQQIRDVVSDAAAGGT